MIMKLYSIYDCKAAVFARPFPAHNNGHAIRLFSDAVNDSKSDFNRHPEDYALYNLADFDDVEGRIGGEPVRVINGLEVIQIEKGG